MDKSDNNAGKSNNILAMSAIFGEFFCKTQKEKNNWKMRMLKAGTPQGVLLVPEDWDSLTEDEKECRLNKVIDILKK